MTDVSMSLDIIESAYTRFENDQVLTADQLNGVSGYLDDQQRLTRVSLIGVGIACGLRPSLNGNLVHLTHGVGTTTDGDVLFMPEATAYDRYRTLDSAAPKYGPFQSGDATIAVFELIRTDETQDISRAQPLSGFASAENRNLTDMAAVLYVESYLHDKDLCTGTDCDNRGQDWIHATRLLLVEVKAAAALARGFNTPDATGRVLTPVVAIRPVLTGALATETDLANAYRPACVAIYKVLVLALDAFFKPSQWLLQDFMPDNPVPQWKNRLDQIIKAMPARGVIQYYYDFLKDLVETYNAFCDSLFGDTAVCCPDVDAFPKHLVLGALDPQQASAAGRTGFYPSPAVSDHVERRARARFLIGKFDALLRTFALPAAVDLRITPSAFEGRSLEERAIPFYYEVREDPAIFRAWSYRLWQKGMERHNYSYNANRYAPSNSAASRPLQAQIGAFDFFRIEGHIGGNVDQMSDAVNSAIAKSNLAFDVVSLSLGQAPIRTFPWRNQDIYRLRDLMRAEVASQLDDTDKFGGRFLALTKTSAGKVVTDDDNDGVPVLGTVQTKVELMAGHSKNAKAKLTRVDYDPDSNWQEDVANLAQAAAEMNEALSPVTKKEFVSPLDAVIGGQAVRFLTWADAIIKGVEAAAAKRSELPGFLAEHPGLEHFAGVLRGGTFVLVYDANKTVVADFMLPYRCCELKAAPPPPPVLTPPKRPEIIFDKPIRIVAIPDKFRLDKLQVAVRNELKEDIAKQTGYFTAFKDSVGIIAGLGKKGTLTGGLITDAVLDVYAADTNLRAEKVDVLRNLLLDPTIEPAKRTTLETQIGVAERDLAASILSTADYVASTGVSVKPGTDAAKALSVASSNVSKVGNADALTNLEKGLKTLSGKAGTSPEMKTVLTGILSARGTR